MTGKEALLKIESFCAYYRDEIDDALDIVAKDLKILEELKKLINGLEDTFNRPGISNDTNILGTIMRDYFIDNSEQIKEWLDND